MMAKEIRIYLLARMGHNCPRLSIGEISPKEQAMVHKNHTSSPGMVLFVVIYKLHNQIPLENPFILYQLDFFHYNISPINKVSLTLYRSAFSWLCLTLPLRVC